MLSGFLFTSIFRSSSDHDAYSQGFKQSPAKKSMYRPTGQLKLTNAWHKMNCTTGHTKLGGQIKPCPSCDIRLHQRMATGYSIKVIPPEIKVTPTLHNEDRVLPKIIHLTAEM